MQRQHEADRNPVRIKTQLQQNYWATWLWCNFFAALNGLTVQYAYLQLNWNFVHHKYLRVGSKQLSSIFGSWLKSLNVQFGRMLDYRLKTVHAIICDRAWYLYDISTGGGQQKRGRRRSRKNCTVSEDLIHFFYFEELGASDIHQILTPKWSHQNRLTSTRIHRTDEHWLIIKVQNCDSFEFDHCQCHFVKKENCYI